MSLLLYSHIINVFIVSLFLLVILIVNINRHVLINLLKAILLFIILTSIFWIPFIQLYFNNWGNINMPIVKQLDNVHLSNFMSGLYESKDTLTMSFFPISSMIISILFYRKFNSIIKQIYLTTLIITEYINKSIVNIICIGVVLFSILLQVFIGQYSMIKKFSQNPLFNYFIKNNQKR